MRNKILIHLFTLTILVSCYEQNREVYSNGYFVLTEVASSANKLLTQTFLAKTQTPIPTHTLSPTATLTTEELIVKNIYQFLNKEGDFSEDLIQTLLMSPIRATKRDLGIISCLSNSSFYLQGINLGILNDDDYAYMFFGTKGKGRARLVIKIAVSLKLTWFSFHRYQVITWGDTENGWLTANNKEDIIILLKYLQGKPIFIQMDFTPSWSDEGFEVYNKISGGTLEDFDLLTARCNESALVSQSLFHQLNKVDKECNNKYKYFNKTPIPALDGVGDEVSIFVSYNFSSETIPIVFHIAFLEQSIPMDNILELISPYEITLIPTPTFIPTITSIPTKSP